MALDGEGRLPEAELALRRALTIREAFGGADWEGLIPVLNNLSLFTAKREKRKKRTWLVSAPKPSERAGDRPNGQDDSIRKIGSAPKKADRSLRSG